MKRPALLALFVIAAACGCQGDEPTVGSAEHAAGAALEVKTSNDHRPRAFETRGTTSAPGVGQTGGVGGDGLK